MELHHKNVNICYALFFIHQRLFFFLTKNIEDLRAVMLVFTETPARIMNLIF